MAYSDYGALRQLLGEMHKVRVGGFEFSGLPDESAVKTFARLFQKQATTFAPNFRALVEDLQRENVRSIVPLPEGPGAGAGTTPRDPRVHGVFTFLKGIAAVHDIMEGLRTGNSVGFKEAKRFVQSAVDLLLQDRGLVLALTSIKNYQDYLYNHSVNVCLLSLVVGARLGFSRNKLADLGLAALLRDGAPRRSWR
jgi:HD-GYP domain-containing protein (c-di-GMP phosphodiesterase class II)